MTLAYALAKAKSSAIGSQKLYAIKLNSRVLLLVFVACGCWLAASLFQRRDSGRYHQPADVYRFRVEVTHRFQLTPAPVQLGSNSSTGFPESPPESTASDTLLVYVYYDGNYNQEDAIMKMPNYVPPGPVHPENLRFFLQHGLDSRRDFLLILHSDLPEYAKLPEQSNVFVWRRQNSCYDLGAFRQGVDLMEKVHRRVYQRYILLNSSVRGPFLPTYMHNTCWTDIVLGMLSPKIKLVGTTANCSPGLEPHVQSMMLAMDRQGFEAALPAMQCPSDLRNAVFHGEIPVTGLILKAGYGARALMPAAAAWSDSLDGCTNGDIGFRGKYFGMNLHPYEVIFIKANRNIDDLALATYTEWHDTIPVNSCPYHFKWSPSNPS